MYVQCVKIKDLEKMKTFNYEFYTVNNIPSHYFEVRRKVYKNDLNLDISSIPDSFDNSSDLFCIVYNGDIIGGARLTVSGKSGVPLQTNGFELTDYIDNELLSNGYGEVSRVFILPEFRSRDILENLYLNMNLKRKTYNISALLTLAPPIQARLTSTVCRRLKFNTDIIRNIDVNSDGPYAQLGEICIVKISD